MKTILLHIESDEGQEARLQVAFDLARAFDAHLHCLQVTPYAAYALGDGGMSGFPVTTIVEAIEAQRNVDRETIEARLRTEGVRWDWASRDGDAVVRLAEASRLADVVVMSAGPFEKAGKLEVAMTGDVAIQAAAPVLAVAPSVRSIALSGPALVAWDGSREAATAMRFSLPMLRHASAVHILTVEEKPSDFRAADAARYLSRHGIEAEVIERSDGGRSVEEVIREEVMRLGAAYMVQGAYGHSRLRQTLFGGVTRGLLSDAPGPLLLAH
ncbi:universal stress protein [Polymorphobacter sp.]|uniref:universal stress protein n=1 Tax=Polymorphobacter sp. TaxID=1909290 RepID=UPI003F71E579